jgi:hypothetical protein
MRPVGLRRGRGVVTQSAVARKMLRALNAEQRAVREWSGLDIIATAAKGLTHGAHRALATQFASGAACGGRMSQSGPEEIVVDGSGALKSPAARVILAASPSIQQLSGGQTSHVNGWTLAVSNWVRFTNDATGHGMTVASEQRLVLT